MSMRFDGRESLGNARESGIRVQVAVTNSRGLPFPCPISRHGGAGRPSRRDYARGLLFRTNLNIILGIMALALFADTEPSAMTLNDRARNSEWFPRQAGARIPSEFRNL